VTDSTGHVEDTRAPASSATADARAGGVLPVNASLPAQDGHRHHARQPTRCLRERRHFDVEIARSPSTSPAPFTDGATFTFPVRRRYVRSHRGTRRRSRRPYSRRCRTLVEVVDGLRPALDHVAQRRVVEDDVRRHASLPGARRQTDVAQHVEEIESAVTVNVSRTEDRCACVTQAARLAVQPHSPSPRTAPSLPVSRSTGYGSPRAPSVRRQRGCSM